MPELWGWSSAAGVLEPHQRTPSGERARFGNTLAPDQQLHPHGDGHAHEALQDGLDKPMMEGAPESSNPPELSGAAGAEFCAFRTIGQFGQFPAHA